ncbi:MAG: exodeoxyribonuclease VII large subunit [Minisyncoccales bacterium]
MNDNLKIMDFTKRYRLGSETPLEVSQFIEFTNEVLRRIRARLIGEVSDLKRDANGHYWFSLRDKKNGNTLRCVIWKYNYQICGVDLKNGIEVILFGSVDIYPVSGQLSFKAETVELVGEGALKKAYDELKEKLSKEGVFDLDKKREIPEYPQRIGIITSLRSGTVIHDFTSNLGKFGFKIKAIDSRVEGQEAVEKLLRAINLFKKEKIDVLVIIRGGGSLESLMAFDNETLVREVASFPVPVIAGIGHHKDVTLVSLAADASESTPTATAQLINTSWEKAIDKINIAEVVIMKGFESTLFLIKEKLNDTLETAISTLDLIFKKYQAGITKINKEILRMGFSISDKKKELSKSGLFLIKDLKDRIDIQEKSLLLRWDDLKSRFHFLKKNLSNQIDNLEKRVLNNDPEKQLSLGYSMIFSNKKIVKTVKGFKKDDLLELKVCDGSMESIIKKIIKNE